MNTPDNNEKPKYTKRIPTEIEYHEKGQWKKGENIITVMGGLPDEPKRPIGFVQLIEYDEFKTPVLAALDLDGNEIFERSSNPYKLKKQFRGIEERLTKALLIREAQPKVAEEPEQDEPEVQKATALKSARKKKIEQDNSQTISH